MSMQKPSKTYPKRGEIYIADLNPGFGQEIHKKRPILIVSKNDFNQTMHTVILLPLSSIVPKVIGPDSMPFPKIKGLEKESVLLITQIRAVDKNRLIKKIGKISQNKMKQVEEALKLVLGLIEQWFLLKIFLRLS